MFLGGLMNIKSLFLIGLIFGYGSAHGASVVYERREVPVDVFAAVTANPFLSNSTLRSDEVILDIMPTAVSRDEQSQAVNRYKVPTALFNSLVNYKLVAAGAKPAQGSVIVVFRKINISAKALSLKYV